MRIRSLILAAALVPSALFTAAAGSASCTVLDDGGTPDGADDVLACESRSYLSCDKALDAGVTGKVHSPIENVDIVLAAPTASFTAGGGCGEVEAASVTGTAMNNIYDLNAAGFVTGNVDAVTFELHSIYAGAQRAGGTMNLDIRFDIDGVSPNGLIANTASGTGTVTYTPKPIRFKVDPVTSSTGLSESFTVTVTDLHKKFPQLSTVGAGADNYKQVNVTVNMVQSDYAGAWVWGATEVPAGVTLNAPADKRGVTVSALTLGG